MFSTVLILQLLTFLAVYRTIFATHENNEEAWSNFFDSSKVNPEFPAPPESPKTHWISSALNTLLSKLPGVNKEKKAKNVIFFLGDGMSLTTVTAARIFQGQNMKKKSGEEEQLSFETFPALGLSKTYCVDSQVADSACSGTAYMTGVKANIATIGVTSEVKKKDCVAEKNPNNRVSSIISWAQDAGKHTGIITTTRITHATPAAGYSHTSNRDFESDANVKSKQFDPTVCIDIASQLILDEPGKNLKVIMGGGRSKFIPKELNDYVSGTGERLDHVNLIDVWIKDKLNRSATPAFIHSYKQLKQLNTSKTDYLLGLFEKNHLKYHLDSIPGVDPTLSEMTKTSIEILQKSKNGFVLFVEGGKIDLAHHDNKAQLSLAETVEFAKAVEVAASMTNKEDTLIVVTADHAHTMTISGYPKRGTNILRYSQLGFDKMPYTTLSYANGPAYQPEVNGKRHNVTSDNFDDAHYRHPAMVGMEYETHGGEDVPVYAQGPYANLFVGVYEQNYIPIAESYAAGIGPYAPSSSAVLLCNSLLITSSTFIIVWLSFFL